MTDVLTRIVAAKERFTREMGVPPHTVRLTAADADAVKAWLRAQTSAVMDVDVSVVRIAGLGAIRDERLDRSRVEGTSMVSL